MAVWSLQNHATWYILKRAILDFRWFYALKATPNRPVESVGLGTPGNLTRFSRGILTVVCGIGHSRDSDGILTGNSHWGWALQRFSRDSDGSLCGVGHSRDSHGILTEVCGVGHSIR